MGNAARNDEGPLRLEIGGADDQILLTIEEAARLLRIGRTTHLDHAMGGTTRDAAVGSFMLNSVTAGFGPFATEIVDTYRSIRPDLSDFRLTGAINSDAAFGQATLAIVELASMHAPAFLYRFDRATVLDGRDLGAIHGAELGYVFADPDDPTARRLSGDVDGELVTAIHDAWSRFITDGKPASDHLPAWTAYDTSSRATMLLDAGTSAVVDDPVGRERELWTRVFTSSR